MKGFFIEVSNNLLERKHYKAMGLAVWLFMWLIDKITEVNKDEGKDLGGKPIKYEDFMTEFDVSRATYVRWMERLKKHGYIQTIRTPYGVCILVQKAKKRFGRKTKRDDSKVTHQSEIGEKKSVKNDSSDVSEVKHQEEKGMSQECNINASQVQHPQLTSATSNKTRAIDNTIDIFQDTPSGMSCQKKLSGEKSFTSRLEEIKIFKNIEDVPNDLRTEATALFLPLYPSQFTAVNKKGEPSTPFQQPHVINALKNILMTTSLGELKELIEKYQVGESDKFRPVASSVYSFCKYKFDAIRTWAAKSTSVLHAHKSISTPEQSKVRDEQYEDKIKESEEEMAKVKSEWEKNNIN